MKIAQAFVEHPVTHLGHALTYTCDGFSVQRGVRVQVLFGKTSVIGFAIRAETITEQQTARYGFTIHPIGKVIDEEPLPNEELFTLGEWVVKTCIVLTISYSQCMLPAKLEPKSTHGHAERGAWIRYVRDRDGLTVKQRAVLQTLQEEKGMLRSQFYQIYETSNKRLVEFGLAQVYEKEVQA